MIGVIYITYADIQKRIRRRKIRFRIFMFIIVLSTIGIYMFTYPIIKVKSIEVSGNNIVPTDKIIALSEINKGDNMLKLNMRRIRENIYTNPYVEVCKVKRSVLGYVYITISERMNVKITLNDKPSSVIKTIVNKMMEAGAYEYTIELQTYDSGMYRVYFTAETTGGQTYTSYGDIQLLK